jgi:3-methylcrotonyl-CoA carboxylase alpha subunit
MIAKLIAHGETREDAIADLAEEMLEVAPSGRCKTNAGFLVRCLEHPDFISGAVDTGLIGRDGEAMAPAEPMPSAAALQRCRHALVPPWSSGSGFRAQRAHRPHRAVPAQRRTLVDVELQGEGSAEPARFRLLTEGGMVWQMHPLAQGRQPRRAR